MRVRAVIDLSVPLDADTQLYPGDPPVVLTPAASIERDGFNLLSVALGSQSGTNCDAPYHFLSTGARIDEVDLRLFAAPGRVIDVRGRPPRSAIGPADLEPQLADLQPGTIVLLHTGWPRYYGTPAYLDHPFLSPDGCSALLKRGVRTIGLDTMSVDETPDPGHPGAGYLVHRMIAGAGGVVVENLTAVDRIDFADPLIVVLPLRLTGADGAPARAVALDIVP